MRLFHYCCSHSVTSIINDGGLLKPNPHAGEQPIASAEARKQGFSGPVIALPLVWLTDVDVREWADAAFIGLESPFVPCNRVRYRFRVPNTSSIERWSDWADAHLDEHVDLPHYRQLLEFGCVSHRWWVSETPLSGCRFDDRYHGPDKEAPAWT